MTKSGPWYSVFPILLLRILSNGNLHCSTLLLALFFLVQPVWMILAFVGFLGTFCFSFFLTSILIASLRAIWQDLAWAEYIYGNTGQRLRPGNKCSSSLIFLSMGIVRSSLMSLRIQSLFIQENFPSQRFFMLQLFLFQLGRDKIKSHSIYVNSCLYYFRDSSLSGMNRVIFNKSRLGYQVKCSCLIT